MLRTVRRPEALELIGGATRVKGRYRTQGGNGRGAVYNVRGEFSVVWRV
jgi:hypothetical protein